MDTSTHFNIVDIAVVVLIIFGLIRGLMKGLSGELAGLLSAAAAVAGGWYGYVPVGNYLAEKTRLSDPAAGTVSRRLQNAPTTRVDCRGPEGSQWR